MQQIVGGTCVGDEITLMAAKGEEKDWGRERRSFELEDCVVIPETTTKKITGSVYFFNTWAMNERMINEACHGVFITQVLIVAEARQMKSLVAAGNLPTSTSVCKV